MLWRNCLSIASRWSTQHVGRLAVGVEQPGLVQEADEVLGFFEHVVEILVFDHHLGRVQLEIHLVEVTARSSGSDVRRHRPTCSGSAPPRRPL